MPSVLSSCLIILKLAMAVNDGLHTMLSNVYSVIESAMQNDDRDIESVQESSSAPAFHRSKSRILEAFSRRRTNLASYEQTDILVSNLTPFQEITITNKDVEGKRKPTVSPIRKSACKRSTISSDKEVESHGETPSPEDSQSLSSSLTSSETTNESEEHSFKVLDGCTQMEEAENNLCRDSSIEGPKEEDVGTHTKFPTRMNISASLSSSEYKSPITNLNYLKSLQEQIRLTSQQLLKPSLYMSNAKIPSVKDVWGLTDFDSTKNGVKVSGKVDSDSAKISFEAATARKELMAEITRLYENFLLVYFSRTYVSNSKTSLKDSDSNSSRSDSSNVSDSNSSNSDSNEDSESNSSSTSNKSQQTFVDNFTPMEIVSSNCSPQTTNSDEPSTNVCSFEEKTKPVASIKFKDSSESYCTLFGCFIDSKPPLGASDTKHIDTVKIPLILNKDSWINKDKVECIKPKNLQKLSETSAWNKEPNLPIQSKECFFDLDSDIEIQPENELLYNQSGVGKDAFEVSHDCQSRVTPSFGELDDSEYLEVLGLARVDALTKVLQKVGAIEVLDEPANILDLLNDITDSTIDIIGGAETKSASASNNVIPNLDNIPLNDLDTEEKQLNYLKNVTVSYLKEMKKGRESKQENSITMDNLFGKFEQRHKVMLENIVNAYKKEFTSLSLSARMCLDPSTDESLRTKHNIPLIGVEIPRKEDSWNTVVSPQQTSAPGELDAFGLPYFVSKVEITEHEMNENESFEIKRKTDLLGLDEDHSESSFSIDGRQNETSTPKRDEMPENRNRVSVNLSSGSLQELEVASGNATSCIGVQTNQNLTFNTNDVIQSLIDNETEDRLVWSPNNTSVRCHSTLEAKDWGDLEAEMSKQYLSCISILNMCDDEAEDANTEKESNYNEDNKVCIEKTETPREIKVDSVEIGDCNEALPQISNETCLEITKDYTNAINACNSDEFKIRKSDVARKKVVTRLASNDGDISSAVIKPEGLSCNDNNELHVSSSLDNEAFKSGASLTEELNSEDDNNKAEVQIANGTQLEMVSKPGNASGLKNTLQNVSSGAASLDKLLSSTNMVFVRRSSNELQMKTSPCKKDSMNKEKILNDFDKEVKIYLKCVESRDKTAVDSIHPSADYSNPEIKFEDQKSSVLRKQSMAKTSSVRTPISYIEALQQKEELESTRIYDEDIYGNETLITVHCVKDSFPDESKGNQNKLACDDEMNNTLISESGLTTVSDSGTKEMFNVSKCENEGSTDAD